MEQNSQNELLIQTANRITKFLEKYEIVFVLLFAVCIIFHVYTSVPVNLIMIILLGTMATMYFFQAFSVTEDENAGAFEIFFFKLATEGSSIGVVGILFRLMAWPNFDFLLLIAGITLVATLLAIFIFKSKKPDLKIFTNALILRIFVIAAIGMLLYFASDNDLTKYKLIEKTNSGITK